MDPGHGSYSSADQAFTDLAEAAMDHKPVTGWTHNFYRYPARFSPRFAAAAIASFTKPGDLVADPYMGGGTSVVEGVASGRHVIGNDLNSLAAFIVKVKVTSLRKSDAAAIRWWASKVVPRFSYWRDREKLARFIDPEKTKNLTVVRARFIKKAVAAALASLDSLPSPEARNFTKCVVLRAGQWALDGRQRHTPLRDFRCKLAEAAEEMLVAIEAFGKQARSTGGQATILIGDAAQLDHVPLFKNEGRRAALIVTSPPYPGVHMLYHRWQVDGRRETPAPYWIAGCNDGEGASYYNFADRRAADDYFRASLTTLTAIRRVVRDGGYMIQMVAFNRPEDQLPRYLANMERAGFDEVRADGRIWRRVPHRKWHACLNGKTHSSNEVVLIHRAS